MSEDKREQILARLEAILVGLADTGINVYRDRAELEDNELPAYVLLDGNEDADVVPKDRRGPQIMRMTPQIFYVPVPPENRMNEGIGPQMAEHRMILIRGIMRDSTLAGLLGSNGYIEYRGMETDMQTGAEVKGQFRMDWAIGYVLNFNKL